MLTCVHTVGQFSNLRLLELVHVFVAVDEGEVGLGGDVGRATVPGIIKNSRYIIQALTFPVICKCKEVWTARRKNFLLLRCE
jgi:hypothetical protein